MSPLPFTTGIVLALVVYTYGKAMRMDRDRAFYSTMMSVIASYYALFAVMARETSTITIEVALMIVFLVVSSLGYRYSLWITVGALAVHGVFDVVHNSLVANPGVPFWWPPFCLAFDITIAAFIALGLKRHQAHLQPCAS